MTDRSEENGARHLIDVLSCDAWRDDDGTFPIRTGLLRAALAEIQRLKEWERASQEGHPSPCTLGPLCPYCEIERQAQRIAELERQLRTEKESRAGNDERWKAENEALRAEVEAEQKAGDMHRNLTMGVGRALGDFDGEIWRSGHDMPERVAALRAERDKWKENAEHWYAEGDRLREALSEEAVERYLTQRCGWSLEWDGHSTMRTAVVATLRTFARAVLAAQGSEVKRG